MDWRRFKTIIIVVLILINVFLGAYLIRGRIKENDEAKTTRQNVISILEKNNIEMSYYSFPKSRESYSACYISRFLESDTEFIENIIGAAEVSGDGFLSGEYGTLEIENEVFRFKLSRADKTELSENGVIEKCRKFMQSNGIYSELYEADAVKIENDEATVRFWLKYDGCKFFDSYIIFNVTQNGIEEIIGENMVRNKNISSYKSDIMSVESIIVSVADDKKANSPVKVESVVFEYYMGKSEGVYKSVLAIPVWVIRFSDGDTLVYDARNGTLIEE